MVQKGISRTVRTEDFEEWLRLACQVEHLFGSMVGNRDFEDALRQCISNAAAFCRVDEQERVEGIIAIDRDGNSIEWLAVDEKARGKNVGHELVRTALENLDSTRDVVVQTFSGEVKEGAAARRLYESFGFVDDKPGGENPAGLGLRDGG